MNKKCATPDETAREKRRAPFAATQFFNIPRECKDGECVFTEVKTSFSWECAHIQFVWHFHLTIQCRQSQREKLPEKPPVQLVKTPAETTKKADLLRGARQARSQVYRPCDILRYLPLKTPFLFGVFMGLGDRSVRFLCDSCATQGREKKLKSRKKYKKLTDFCKNQ